tara:strand:+ start:11427 stop:11762 length:336 start_codon:yes stop_codon:yes gene_type:complete
MRDAYKKTFINSTREYQEKLKKRHEADIIQYATPTLTYPDLQDYQFLDYATHIWKTGDKLYKLSNDYYTDPSYWWVIAMFNQKPTEAHYKIGDELYIPLPLTKVLSLMGYE